MVTDAINKLRCMIYVDLNMVRSGLVTHPSQWIKEELHRGQLQRVSSWSESIAVGSEMFVKQTKEQLKPSVYHLKCTLVDDKYVLKEPEIIYDVHLPPEKG